MRCVLFWAKPNKMSLLCCGVSCRLLMIVVVVVVVVVAARSVCVRKKTSDFTVRVLQ